MAATWQQVISNPEFAKETPQAQVAIAESYFEKVIKPQVIANGDDIDAVRQEFFSTAVYPRDQSVPEAPQAAPVEPISSDGSYTTASIVDQLGGVQDQLGTIREQHAEESQAAQSVEDKVSRSTFQEPQSTFGYRPAQMAEHKAKTGVDIAGATKTREAADYMAEAQELINAEPEKYAGRSVEDVAYDLSADKRTGQAAEAAVTVATLPFGIAGGLGRVLASNAAIGAGTELAGQAAESLSGGENRFDLGDVAQTSALSGVLGAAGKKAGDLIGKGIGKYVDVRDLNKTLREADVPESEMIRYRDAGKLRKAEDVSDRELESIEAVKDLNRQAREEERFGDVIQLTPAQVFREGKMGGKMADIERAAKESDSNPITRRYRDQTRAGENIGEGLIRSHSDEVTDLGKEPKSFLSTLADDLKAGRKTNVSKMYNESIDGADKALKRQGDLGPVKIQTPNLQTKINELRKTPEDGLDTIISPAIKRDLNKIESLDFKNFKQVDKVKRQINERRSDAWDARDMATYRIYADLGNALKADANDFASKQSSEVASLWGEADRAYTELMSDFGKGTTGARLSGEGKELESTIQKFFDTRNGPNRIKEINRLVRRADDNDGQFLLGHSVATEAAERAMNKATSGRTSDFNMGAFRKEMDRYSDHIKAADPALGERWDATAKAFDIMRAADLSRQSKMFDSGTTSRTLLDTTTKIGGAALGTALAGPIGLLGAIAAPIGSAVTKSVKTRSALNLADFVTNNSEAIWHSKVMKNAVTDINSSNPARRVRGAEVILDAFQKTGAASGRELAD